MRIALAGNGGLAVSLARALLASSHEIVAIVQNGRRVGPLKKWIASASAGVFAARSTMLGIAMHERIPVIWLDRMTPTELAPLEALRPDVLLVGGFGIILKEPILQLPRICCVNVHPSLLPRHRGPNPFSAAILSGDKETGITFHLIDTGIDTGAVLEQYSFPIEDEDTALSVYDHSCSVAAEHIVAAMNAIARNGPQPTPQDETRASYDPKLTVKDAHIDWHRPARDIHRLWRACRPTMLPRFKFREHSVVISQMVYDDTPVTEAPGTVLPSDLCVRVATGEGTITIITAYSLRPFPWAWPAPWSKPHSGMRLE